MLTTTRPKKITINYRPLPKQKAFHQAQNKFTGYIGGLGSGKTYAGAMKAISFMLSHQGSQGMIAAPNYPMLRKSTMPTFFEILPPELIKNYHKTYHELELINGAKTFFVSTEKPDHLRGPNLSWWWYDEASSGSRTSFDVLVGRLRVGKAKAWVTGTPKGFNWVYERFADPIKKLQDTFLIASSSRENTYLPSDYVPMLERTYTGAFAKQEIEGEFVGFEGLVYPDFSYEAHCRPEFPIEKRGLPAYVGVDFGYTNPSALILVTVDSDDRIWIWEEFYQSGVFVEELIKQIKTWQSQGFNIHSCFC
ncbi:MAG: phage terminase large subunit, partial [Candidatus Diapherotrites archaeon]|nr:phage terminase large subunit [Candidatus Diapherotrites archaeon]